LVSRISWPHEANSCIFLTKRVSYIMHKHLLQNQVLQIS
jgi:hypothetical protein